MQRLQLFLLIVGYQFLLIGCNSNSSENKPQLNTGEEPPVIAEIQPKDSSFTEHDSVRSIVFMDSFVTFYVTKPDVIKSRDRLIVVGYGKLEEGSNAVYRKIQSIREKGFNYFISIKKAYNSAYKEFIDLQGKLNDQKVDEVHIASAVITDLSAGALSWVSETIKVSDLLDDIMVVTLDEFTYSHLQGTDSYIELNLKTFLSSIKKINSEIRNSIAYIYENKKDVSDYCKTNEISELSHYLDVYSKVSDETKELIKDLTPIIKNYQKNIIVVDKNLLEKEFEYSFWIEWILSFDKSKLVGYGTDIYLSEEIVKKFKDLKIGNLKTNGNGRVQKGELTTFIKKVEKEFKGIKTSL